MRKKFLAVLLSTVMVVVTGCGSGHPSPAEEDGKNASAQTQSSNVHILQSNGGPQEFFETPWLNPGTFIYNKVLYDTLILADHKLNPLPGEGQLAQSYTISEDGMEIEFVLRDGLKWHDGEPITTDDIKWSIEYAKNVPALNAVFKGTFDAISEIQTTENTINIKFSKLSPDALLTFTQFAPLPKKYFGGVEPTAMQQAEFFQNPIGSGPFKVEEVAMNNYTILEPYQDYYGGIAEFNINLSPSPGDSDPNFVTNAKGKKLDFATTKSISDIRAVEGTKGINLDQIDIRYTRLLYPNKFPDKEGNISPLSDIRVRQALMYALDMPSILEGVFQGAATPANSLTPDDKPEGLDNYDYDPEKAKALLAEAGWDPNTELDLVYYYTDQQTVDLMTIIQHYWSQVGVKMNFKLVEGDLGTILWTPPVDPINGPSEVDWDLAYGAIAALSLHEYYDRFLTGNSINSHTPGIEELDNLINATNLSLDPAETQKAFHDLIKYENENLFAMPLYYQPTFILTSENLVSGPEILGNPNFRYNWDIVNWEVN